MQEEAKDKEGWQDDPYQDLKGQLLAQQTPAFYALCLMYGALRLHILNAILLSYRIFFLSFLA